MARHPVHEMEVGIRMNKTIHALSHLIQLSRKVVPYAAIGFLISSGMFQIGKSIPSKALSEYHGDIAEQIDAFPYQVGRWVGQDVVVPTSAQEILQPNGLVSRRFSQYGGEGSLTFALIHCIDLRDMHGHHPPRCYPASGWSFNDESLTGVETIDVRIGEVDTEMSVYRFKQGGPLESSTELTVVSVFVTPMAGIVNDMAVLQELGSLGRGASSLGVGQIQFVFGGDMTTEELHEMVNDFASRMPRDLLKNMMSFPESEEFEDLRKYSFDESERS